MKFSALLLVLAITSTRLHAEVMAIYFTDGTQKRIPVSEVNRITFSSETAISAKPSFRRFSNSLHIGNSGRMLTFSLAQKCPVRIRIYDAFGRIVRKSDFSERMPGIYHLDIQSMQGSGPLAQGYYFIRATMGDKIITTNFLMLK